MTPDQLAKSGSEHGEQRALFAWAAMAEAVGFDLAWDDRLYETGSLVQFLPGGCNRHIASPVPELHWMHAIPNGGLRDKATAGRLKSEGVKRGIVDIFLPLPMVAKLDPLLATRQVAMFHGLYVEMKRGETFKPGTRKTLIVDRAAGKTSDEQEDFIAHARRVGYAVAISFDWRQAAKQIEHYITEVRANV